MHVLNRLTFGTRPGDVERLQKVGIERWIDQQLNPELITDSAGARAVIGCAGWTEPLASALAASPVRPGLRLLRRDSARKLPGGGALYLSDGQLIACRLARVERSEQQLLEVMNDFWQNHFSFYGAALPVRNQIFEWDRAVIRPNALGRFRDLIGAVAHSPIMLNYLDNTRSSAPAQQPTLAEYMRARAVGAAAVTDARTGLNENFARELLELHTMGVDGGYTQADVIAVARAFTGWTHGPRVQAIRLREVVISNGMRFQAGVVRTNPGFEFDSTMHDAGEKVVLGRTLPAGRGLEDGEEVLDLLARHPATARFIARKLVVRFVSDTAPEALVERAAAKFLQTDGDIREVMRVIVTSPEFLSPNVYGAKIKSPLELVLSTRRVLMAPIDTLAEVTDLLIALDQPPYGHPAPDGWPETGADWMNAGAIIARMKFALGVGRGELPSIPLQAWPAWRSLSLLPFEQQVDGVINNLLNGRATPALRAALLASQPTTDGADTADSRHRALRELVALTLASPEFQRR